MIAEAITKILTLGEAQVLKIEDREYSNKQLYPIREDGPAPLLISTLTGIVDYLKKNVDKFSAEELLIHVASPTEVTLMSILLAPWGDRHRYVKVVPDFKVFPFGQYQEVESFIIGLQSQFVQDEMTAEILKLVGNLKDENVMNIGDDGKSQQVTVRSGISSVAVANVPNPVELAPFRTFREIAQPSSRFVLRMKQGGMCALFEADGGAWKNEAVIRIKKFLEEAVPDVSVIA